MLLAGSFLSQVWPAATLVATLAMYVFIILVIVDGALMWRGFKKVLAAADAEGVRPRACSCTA